MPDFANRDGAGATYDPKTDGLEARIQRTMMIVIGLSVALSIVVAPWRVTSGLLLGGLLSLLNHNWMKSSIKAAFASAAPGAKPQVGLVKYVLRYFAVGLAVYAAYAMNLISLPATIAGLCSFVAALFAEAFRELYLTIVHREEIG